MKIRHLELECSMRKDGRTYRQTYMTVTFRNFENAPKNAKWNQLDAEFCVLQIYVLIFDIPLFYSRKLQFKNSKSCYTDSKTLFSLSISFNLHDKTECQQQRTIYTCRRPITCDRKKRREENIKNCVRERL
jgi:hypothetical protein